MASQVPLEPLAEMDVMEPRENRAARERLDPKDLPLLKDRKENLESRAQPVKKESEGRKERVGTQQE